MLLPQTKEREYRFKLALRIGLPIFALILAFISHTLIKNYQNLQASFYVEATLVMLVSIYFIFYLIYNGFSVKITDEITKTFTREYLYNYLKKAIQEKKEYTLMLISIENLHDINMLYGIKNGDKVLREVVVKIADFFEKEGIENFPLGHIKGGDFILGIEGSKERYKTLLELLELKMSELKVADIEVKIATALTDTHYSRDLEYLIENLFEIVKKEKESDENFTPNELESAVIWAISHKDFLIMTQNVYCAQKDLFYECFIKLKTPEGKIIYPKSYMKVINKLGLGIEFDLAVLEKTLDIFRDKKELFALNISSTSLRNEKFLQAAKTLLQGKKSKVMFILFEMEYYSHKKRYNAIIKNLKEYGVFFCIDRVASIHTSFLYLRELDVDYMRFDSYYSSIEHLKQSKGIIDGFNLIAYNKGIKSWIKNIEDEESYALVQELSIDCVQGKYLSKLNTINGEN